ncbi:MAG: helix-turn-helix domain-containing protein [Actinomycetes bacterium]
MTPPVTNGAAGGRVPDAAAQGGASVAVPSGSPDGPVGPDGPVASGVWLAGVLSVGPSVADRYVALVEQLPAVVYLDLPDEADTTLYVSPRIREVLGIEPDYYVNAEGNPWIDQLHPDDRDDAVLTFHRLLVGGGGQQEYRMIRPTDGQVVWIQDRFVVLGEGDEAVVQGFMVDVTREREDALTIAAQLEMLQRSERIGSELTRLVLEHGDVTRIVRSVARVVGNPVVLTDDTDAIVAADHGGRPSDDLEVLFRQHLVDAGHVRIDDAPATLSESDGTGSVSGPPVAGRTNGSVPCIWQDVWLRDHRWGRIHVLETARPADRVDELALDRGVAALGLALLLEREAGHLAESARSTVANDLVQGRIGSTRELVRRVRAQGVDLGHARLAVAVVLPIRARPVRRRGETFGELVREVRERAATARLKAFVAADSDRVLVILAPGAADVRRLAAALAGPDWVVGVSGVDDDRPVDGYIQALEAAEHARELPLIDGLGVVVRFEDLGLRHLLGRLAEGPELRRFVDDELGALIRHDLDHSAVLLPTLRAFLDEHGSKTRAARVLHVERRTMYYRLERISDLLGRDLDDRETRLRLDVAMRGRDLLLSRDSAR